MPYMEERRERRDDRRSDKTEKEDKVIRKKKCRFCIDKVEAIDYKDTLKIRKNLTERGKMIPRRITGNCSSHQRQLACAVKRARFIALIPFILDQ